MSPIAKLELGWLGNVIDVTEAELHEYALKPVQTSEQVLRVPLQGTDEFLLIEFRDKIGFDRALPAAGVLVYHMEPGRAYPCADCERLYPFLLVEADGRGDLLRTSLEGGNIGEASDMFGATGPVSFTNYTNPATHLNSGDPSVVSFYRIAIEGGVAAISLSTSPTSVERLVEPFLQGGAVPLTDPEKEFFDSLGNDNGRYDVGDLRARLRR
jgi:immune inhibitor A